MLPGDSVCICKLLPYKTCVRRAHSVVLGESELPSHRDRLHHQPSPPLLHLTQALPIPTTTLDSTPYPFPHQLNLGSQLIILIKIHRLKQPANLHSPLPLSVLGALLLLLALLLVQLGVVARELLELDQKVSQVDFEAGQVLAVGEEALDKGVYLDAAWARWMVSLDGTAEM